MLPTTQRLPLIAILILAVFTILPRILFSAPASSNDRISTGDALEMRILQETELQCKVRVSIDGTIFLPLIGQISATGKSVATLHSEIFELYNDDLLVKPQVALAISSYAQCRARVRGELNRPGFVVIPPEDNLTTLDVITASGDITNSGNGRKVVLRTSDQLGKPTVMVIDLTELEKQPNPEKIS